MKKLVVLALMFSASVIASPKDVLSERLSKTNGFSASFTQIVVSPDDEIIMEGEGQVEIARPSLFRWTTTMPDENVLVSDGKILWYYSPFVEQVSIYWQEQATAQTPFVLLTRNRTSDWDNYSVSQDGNRFTLTPTAIDSNQGQFQVDVDADGIIKGFNVIEQDGQQGQFVFTNYSSEVPNKKIFSFSIPDGVEVDDQRE
jgi:outer membrane lipoprotein carrier protein